MKIFDNTVFHTAIIGGGAAGLFCAGSFSAHKIVLEANDKLAQKVRVSGGGKCNFSNRCVTAQDYQSSHKHFCKNALAAFQSSDFLNLLQQAAIPWEEREQGRFFAKNANDVVQFLIQRAKKANTQFACGVQVLDLQYQDGLFTLHTSAGTIQANHVVLATGGPSYPALGGSSFGWQLARRLGLHVIEPRPVLCGLKLPKPQRMIFAPLAGNSLPVRVHCEKHHVEDQLLFAHEGFSGPAILQISLFWKPGQPIEIDFLPHTQAAVVLSQHKTKNQLFSSVLKDYFPGKTAKILLQGQDVPLSNASRLQLENAIKQIHQFSFTPTDTFGYTKAEATAGGVDPRELNATTLQTRSIPGLYIIGELVDVTGRVGGFNLQWAWSSAFAAAKDLAHKF